MKLAEDAVKDSVQKRQKKKIRGVGLSQELTEILRSKDILTASQKKSETAMKLKEFKS